MESKNRMMGKMLPDDALDTVAGGAGSSKSAEAEFDVGDWVCYVGNTQIVAKITRRQYNESCGWQYGVKFNGEGQELYWVGESLMTKASKPN